MTRNDGMTEKQWREALAQIEISQLQFAALLRVEDRTVRRWISGTHNTPRPVAILVELLCRGKITLADLGG